MKIICLFAIESCRSQVFQGKYIRSAFFMALHHGKAREGVKFQVMSLAKKGGIRVEITGNPELEFPEYTVLTLFKDQGNVPMDFKDFASAINDSNITNINAFHLYPEISENKEEVDGIAVKMSAKHLGQIMAPEQNGKGDEEVSELKTHLAHFTRWFSISSIFGRGQAAIGE